MHTTAVPSISTDHIAAFVELARQGSLRAAAQSLFISEQGLRSRLLALEHKLSIQLYKKSRGLRRRESVPRDARRRAQHGGHRAFRRSLR